MSIVCPTEAEPDGPTEPDPTPAPERGEREVDGGSQRGPVLSARQEQVLALLIRGYGSLDIAAYIGIDRKTVDSHRARLLKLLGLRGNIELAYWAIDHGRIAANELRAVWSRPRSPGCQSTAGRRQIRKVEP